MRTSDRRWRLLAGALVVLALALRLGAVAATGEYVPRTDDAHFDRIALSIAAGEGYPPAPAQLAGSGPSAFRPPGYSFLLGGVYALAGSPEAPDRWTVARSVQAVLGAATVALVGLLALMLFGPVAALLALGLAAVFPPLMIPSASLLSESLFIPLELGAVAAALRFRQAPSALRWAAVAGLLTGAAALTRSNGMLLVLPLAIGIWAAARGSRRPLVAAAVFTAAAVLTVAPWTVRNAVRLDAFVPITTQSGYGLAGTYNDLSRGDDALPASWRPPTAVPEYAAIIERGDLSEAEVSRELRSRSLAFIRDDPPYVARVGWWNLRRVLNTSGAVAFERREWGYLGVGDRLSDASVFGFWILGALGLLSLATGVWRKVPLFVWAVPLVLLAPAIPIAGNTRYRIPADPYLVLLVAGALAAVLLSRSARERPA